MGYILPDICKHRALWIWVCLTPYSVANLETPANPPSLNYFGRNI